MTPAARTFLAQCVKRQVYAVARDPAWSLITELQRAGLVRLDWTATKVARIVPTDKGRAELAKVAA